MVRSKDFIVAMHRRVAQVAIGSSALRNQGAPGVVGRCRSYMEHKVNLRGFAKALQDERAFGRWLDKHTEALVADLPVKAKRWGAARKAINLFLRDVCYNTVLAHHIGLSNDPAQFNKAIQWLEVPLDKDVAIGLRKEYPTLKKWPGIRYVCPAESKEYQAKAMQMAKAHRTVRIHLDLTLWRAAPK
jgi:hypothetical protein